MGVQNSLNGSPSGTCISAFDGPTSSASVIEDSGSSIQGRETNFGDIDRDVAT